MEQFTEKTFGNGALEIYPGDNKMIGKRIQFEYYEKTFTGVILDYNIGCIGIVRVKTDQDYLGQNIFCMRLNDITIVNENRYLGDD